MIAVALPRRARATSLPITPLVDILLILLIFFMVTSTYLDLDMIPVTEPAAVPEPDAPAADEAAALRPMLVRLDADGSAVVAGERLGARDLVSAVSRNGTAHPGAPVVVLPSPRASLQALVDLLATLTAAGAPDVSVVRIEEARP